MFNCVKIVVSIILFQVLFSCGKIDAVAVDYEDLSLSDTLTLTDLQFDYMGRLFISANSYKGKGYVFKSTDYGKTVAIDLVAERKMNCLSLSMDSVVYAAGDSMFVYMEQPNEKHWRKADPPTWEGMHRTTNLMATVFMDMNNGVCVGSREFDFGNILFITRDFWDYELVVGHQPLNDIIHLYDSTFLAVGYGTIAQIDFPSKSYKLIPFAGDNLTSVIRYEGGVLACSYTGKIYAADAFGLNWHEIANLSKGRSLRVNLRKIVAVNDKLYVCGERGFIASGGMDGSEWQELEIDRKEGLHDIEYFNGSLFCSGKKGVLLRIQL